LDARRSEGAHDARARVAKVTAMKRSLIMSVSPDFLDDEPGPPR
jgi:hypothetical protein